MMENYKLMFRAMNFETEILEAVDWDEEICKETIIKLSEYFTISSRRDLDLAKADLDHVFSKEVCAVIYRYMDSMFADIVKSGEQDET